MATVETTIRINAPLERVYAIAKDNESFPEFMKDVKSLVIIEREPNRTISDWVGIVPTFGLKVRWRQEDRWDDATHTCDFKQIEGDYDSLDGVWNFTDADGGCQFDSVVNYEYNVPTLGPLVKKVIHSIVVKNMENVLQAIKERAEAPIS